MQLAHSGSDANNSNRQYPIHRNTMQRRESKDCKGLHVVMFPFGPVFGALVFEVPHMKMRSKGNAELTASELTGAEVTRLATVRTASPAVKKL